MDRVRASRVLCVWWTVRRRLLPRRSREFMLTSHKTPNERRRSGTVGNRH